MHESEMKSPSHVPTSACVRVKLFALARQLAGQEVVEVTVRDPVTVGAVRAALSNQIGPLAPLVRHSLFAVGTQYAADDSPLRDGDELAMIPPVSGG